MNCYFISSEATQHKTTGQHYIEVQGSDELIEAVTLEAGVALYLGDAPDVVRREFARQAVGLVLKANERGECRAAGQPVQPSANGNDGELIEDLANPGTFYLEADGGQLKAITPEAAAEFTKR